MKTITLNSKYDEEHHRTILTCEVIDVIYRLLLHIPVECCMNGNELYIYSVKKLSKAEIQNWIDEYFNSEVVKLNYI